MLVMDEATSALDYSTEQEVSRNLKEALKGRTVFFITHRLKTIQDADVDARTDGHLQGTPTHLGLVRHERG